MQYELIEGFTAASLSNKVTQRLSEGWKLHGAVVPIIIPPTEEGGSYDIRFCQVVIAED